MADEHTKTMLRKIWAEAREGSRVHSPQAPFHAMRKLVIEQICQELGVGLVDAHCERCAESTLDGAVLVSNDNEHWVCRDALACLRRERGDRD